MDSVDSDWVGFGRIFCDGLSPCFVYTIDLLPGTTPPWLRRLLCLPSSYVVLSAGIVTLDWMTGPHIRFPVLLVLPLALSAWYIGAKLAYSLAILLSISRLFTLELRESVDPPSYCVVNAVIRVIVFVLLVILVRRLRAQTLKLEEKMSGLVRMCAWSRTVEYEGRWISFEEYLKLRFNLDTSHGMSPAEAEKFERQHGAGGTSDPGI